ncbi:MAG TPA: DnaA/Hda family protein [Burkholderiaceae bacterium]|nr:DnaA/Hda family protein [Burkholderiaceae bacterium]
MISQIPFDFARPGATLANFVPGRNTELLARLEALDFPAVLYLWGEAGSGKTHLIEATRETHGPRVVVADNAQSLNAAEQEALFDAFNRTLQGGAKLVVAGDAPPLRLQHLREDLRTRLGAGLVFEVQPLSDDEKRLAIRAAAHERGLALGDEFVAYLLTHFPRDLRRLIALLDALDRYSLAAKRPVTLPLLRELLRDDQLAAR